MLKGAVIGAGIGGLAAAVFARQRGLDLPVYEKAAALKCADNLLWLAPNGLHLLAALGVNEAVLKAAAPQQNMLFSSKELRPLLGLDCAKLAATNGYPIVAIKRGVLYQIILDRLLALGGAVHFAHELVNVANPSGRAVLTFKGQKDPVAVDVLIAADGIGSTVRRQLWPESTVKYQGLRTYLGRSVTPVSARYVGQTIETWGVGTRFVLTSLDAQVTYWSAIERPDVYQSNNDPIAPDQTAQLQAAFADYHPDIVEVLNHVVPESIHRCNFGVVTGLKSYGKGPVALLGDAAHGMPPNMGQGASLALEDAYLLVAELTKGVPPETALETYNRVRLPRAKQMMQMANSMNGTFQPRSRWASRLRNSVALVVPDGLSQQRMARLYQVPFSLDQQLAAAAGQGVT